MIVPEVIDDGNWNSIQPFGMSGDYSFPFSEKGDGASFEATLKYRQDKTAYRPRPLMSVLNFTLGRAYLTKLGNPRDIGANIFEYEDTFSAVPANRTEYGSFPYTMQWWKATADADVDPSKYFYNVNYDIEEQTFTVFARVQYEYFLNTPPDPLLKPRVFLLFGFLQTIGGAPPQSDSSGNVYVTAEDSQVQIWKCRIFERRTIQVRVVNATPYSP